MANKTISELPQAQNVNNQDLFVLEQGGIAKKLTAETFITEQGIIDALAEALDGHGGIQSVTLSNVSGRIRTYLITFTDGSATTFQVYDGTTIERIAKTSTAGLVDTYTIFMNDGTTTFFTVTNGADGTVSEEMLNDALKDKAPAITETTESSAIATFTDGADDMVMHNVIAEINPVQNLTYGDPYPAGSGANILPPLPVRDVTRNGITFKSDGNGTYSLSGTASSSASILVNLDEPITYTAGTYYMSILNNAYSGLVGFYGVKTSGNAWDIVINANNKTQQITFEADTTITALSVYIGNGSTVNYTFSPVLSKTGFVQAFTPYSNICPISGHTEVNVTRCGKLYDSYLDETVVANGLTIKKSSNHRIKISGTITGQVDRYLSTAFDGTGETLNLYITQPVPYTNTYIYIYDTTSYSAVLRLYGNTQTSGSFTTVTGHSYRVGILCPNNGGTYDMDFTVSVTGAPPETFSLSWQTEAGTVYGGTIDVATGLLTVDRATVEFDGSDDESWSLQSVNSYNIANFSISHTHYSGTANYLALCNYLTAQTSAIAATQTNGFLVHQNGSTIYIRLSTSYASTVAELRTWLANNPLQIVYGLTTPQTYQLSGQQLKTLYGTNSLFSNVGNVSVTYPADTKLFIEKLTMPTEDDMVANQAITSGQYFMIGNSLYLALANIASGAQITIGTNAQRVSLADALNTINS